MLDKDKYTDQPDEFSQKIRKKIDGHRMSVDDDLWSVIEAQSRFSTDNENRKRNTNTIKWISTIAAIAAVIALVFLVMPDSQPLTEMVTAYTDVPLDKKEVEQGKVNDPTVGIEKERPLVVLAKEENQKNRSEVKSESIEINKENEDIVDVPIALAANDNNVSSQDISTSEPKEEVITEITPLSHDKYRNDTPVLLLPKKKDEGKWLIAASFSSGSGRISETDVFTRSLDHAMSDEAENTPILADPGVTNTVILANEDFTDVDHALPLSFGFSVRKDLNKYIGIETGLNYTYLSSTFERVNIPKYKVKQELHYLGIPLNLVVNLWNDSKWNVYVSGGAMLEKGLQQKYTQDMYDGNEKVSSTSEKGSVKGVQWSLNAAAGASYAFYQDLSLYVEPRFSRYLDSDQPISIRTDKTNIFSLAGGVRYKF